MNIWDKIVKFFSFKNLDLPLSVIQELCDHNSLSLAHGKLLSDELFNLIIKENKIEPKSIGKIKFVDFKRSIDPFLFNRIIQNFLFVEEINLEELNFLIEQSLNQIMKSLSLLKDLRIIRFGTLHESKLPVSIENLFLSLAKFPELREVTFQNINFMYLVDRDNQQRFFELIKPLKDNISIKVYNLTDTRDFALKLGLGGIKQYNHEVYAERTGNAMFNQIGLKSARNKEESDDEDYAEKIHRLELHIKNQNNEIERLTHTINRFDLAQTLRKR
jgi:hypothetical protein